MTVGSSTSTAYWLGNGATTTWDFTFPYYNSTDIVVTLYDKTLGTTTVLSPALYSIVPFGTGGRITYPLMGSPISSDFNLGAERIVPYTQTVDIVNQSGFYPAIIETALDRLTMQVQQVAAKVSRSIQYSVASGSSANYTLSGSIADGKALVMTAGVISEGPDADQIASAQSYAIAAAASAAAAATFNPALYAALSGATFTGVVNFSAAVNVNALVTFADPTTPTKKFKFDAAPITAGQTRTLTLPDKDITLRDSQWELIQKVTISGNPSAVDFTNLSGYERLRVSGWVYLNVDSTNFNIACSQDNGATFPAGATDYVMQYLLLTNANTVAAYNGNASSIKLVATIGATLANASTFSCELFAFNKSAPTTMIASSQSKAASDGNMLGCITGRWIAGGSNPANAIRLVPQSGTITGGIILLEGIRG